MAALGLLESVLGFDETRLCGLMIATYIAMDSFVTATNVRATERGGDRFDAGARWGRGRGDRCRNRYLCVAWPVKNGYFWTPFSDLRGAGRKGADNGLKS